MLQMSKVRLKNRTVIIEYLKIILSYFSVQLWLWSYGTLIYNYLYQCQSPLALWVQILLMASCTQYNIMW